jgi:PAS domain S-box-containing protein
MSVATASRRRFLEQHREDVATCWYEAVVQDGSLTLDSAVVRQQFLALTDRVITLLTIQEMVLAEARAIGIDLAELRYVHAEGFGRTLEVLAGELVSGLPAADLATLQPRLASLLGELTVGFLKHRHAAVLAEQDLIHRALVAAPRQVEEARWVSEARYRAVATQVTEGVVVVDASTARILEANPGFHHLLGYPEGELRGVSLYDLVPHDPARIDEGIRRTLQQGDRAIDRSRCRRKDGTLATIEGNATAIGSDSGTLLSIVVRDAREQGGWIAEPAEDELPMTQQEWQLVALLAEGRGNSQIADELNLGEQTVRNYLSRLYVKLGVSSRTAAVAWFQGHRLLPR